MTFDPTEPCRREAPVFPGPSAQVCRKEALLGELARS